MISVIIPVYNVSPYLQYCIDSLLAQTYKDIEFLFINDASTDNSLEILKKNEELHSDRIRVIDSPEHINLGGVRNLGVKASRGEYVGFVDSDDMVAPDMYEVLADAISLSKADVAFCEFAVVDDKTDYLIIEQSPDYWKPGIEWNGHLLEIDDKKLSNIDRNKLHIYPIGGIWSGLWKKSVIVDNNIFWPSYKYEDNYWFSLIMCYVERVKFIKKVKYYYRKNPLSTMNKRNQVYALDRIKVEQSLLQSVKERELFLTYYSVWEYTYICRYALNTFLFLISRWDVIPYKQLAAISKDVKTEFPHWYQSIFYKTELNCFRKILAAIAIDIPTIGAFICKLAFKVSQFHFAMNIRNKLIDRINGI